MYQVQGRDVLFDWLAHEPDMDRRQALLDYLVELCSDPESVSYRVPGIRAPVYLAIVPVARPIAIKFLLAEQFRTIKLAEIGQLG